MTGPVNRLDPPNFANGLCVGEDPELWFAEDTLNPVRDDVELARAICFACTIQAKCLAWGMKHEEFGMWGGLTANDRRNVKSKRWHKLTHLTEWMERNGYSRIH